MMRIETLEIKGPETNNYKESKLVNDIVEQCGRKA
jgi:hypothetical protein